MEFNYFPCYRTELGDVNIGEVACDLVMKHRHRPERSLDWRNGKIVWGTHYSFPRIVAPKDSWMHPPHKGRKVDFFRCFLGSEERTMENATQLKQARELRTEKNKKRLNSCGLANLL